MTDTDLEQRLRALLSGVPERRIDTGRGWRDFQSLRARASRNRRRRLTAAAVAGIAAVLAIVPILLGSLGTGGSRHPQASTSRASVSSPPSSYRNFPGAVVARIPVAGVVGLAQDGNRIWAVAESTVPGSTTFQLVGIDPRTGKVTISIGLGSTVRYAAAGDGAVWLDTTHGRSQGQLVRIDPVTGKIVATAHLRTGRCGYLTFSGGQLWAECSSSGFNEMLFHIDPATGRVLGRLGPVHSVIGQIAVTPRGVWYADYSGIGGIVAGNGAGPGPRAITVRDPSYPVSFAYTQSLVYSQGALWALTNDESVAKINPATGHVERVFSSASYDPKGAGGLDFLTAGQGSLWFLDDGYPFSGVLRVSMATGRPLGGVTVRPGSCGQPCYQIYDTNGTIWVPTSTAIIGIDPARLPA
ncbi:MAG TPA: hypothetical protein VN840_16830 [Streptosporangiaceae bacterium]|nr:hypothetical protein [Streptosporangiaceae bacterium]